MKVFIFHIQLTVFSIAFVPQKMITKSTTDEDEDVRLENHKYANVTP